MLNKKFVSQPSAIASYPYTDLAENTGVQLFYGAAQATSAGTTYFIKTNQVYSKIIECSSTNAVRADYEKVLDLDFDLTPFNAPQDIRGTAFFNFFMRVYWAGGGVADAYAIVRVRKWDGTTETEIADAQTDGTTSSSGTSEYNFVCLPLSIPRHHFTPGENLRITIEGWLKCENAGTLRIGTDPMNRDGAVNYIVPSTDTNPVSTTQLKMWIPFDLDL